MKKSPSTHALGAARDRKVLHHIELNSLLTQEQIHLLEFAHRSKEMSYRCTARLEKKQRIRRGEGLTRSEPDWFFEADRKKPSQIEHRIGKSWIYVYHYLRVKWSEGRENLVYFKDEETQFKTEHKLQPDSYFVIDQANGRRNYIFGEYQDIGNAWNKNYRSLLQSFSKEPDTSIMLFILLSDHSKNLEAKLKKDYSHFPGLKLSIMTLNQLRDFLWRVAIERKGVELYADTRSW